MSKNAPKPVAEAIETPVVEATVEVEPTCCEQEGCTHCIFEPVAPVAAPEVAPEAKTYTAKAGDTYASIAKAHKTAGQSTHAYAQELYAANGNKPLTEGTVVKL